MLAQVSCFAKDILKLYNERPNISRFNCTVLSIDVDVSCCIQKTNRFATVDSIESNICFNLNELFKLIMMGDLASNICAECFTLLVFQPGRNRILRCNFPPRASRLASR